MKTKVKFAGAAPSKDPKAVEYAGHRGSGPCAVWQDGACADGWQHAQEGKDPRYGCCHQGHDAHRVLKCR
jgi:hypothetical protein